MAMNLFHGLCKTQIFIIHGKFMSLNQGHEIDNCKIHDHEKRFMDFSGTLDGIFIKLMLVLSYGLVF